MDRDDNSNSNSNHSSSSSPSSGEEEAQKDPAAFNELTDIVLSLKDKTYEALLRP